MSRQDKSKNKVNYENNWNSIFSSLSRIEIVMLSGGVLLLMVLIYTIQSILSPFIVLGALIFILYPLKSYVLARNLMWLAVVLFSIWFVNSISTILAPFLVSIIFAYILHPIVDRFEKWGVTRWLTSLILILMSISVLTLILVFVLPIAYTQFENALDMMSGLMRQYSDSLWESNIIKTLERYGITEAELRGTFSNKLTPQFEDILKTMVKATGSLMVSIKDFITQVFYIILVPFLTFYFLTDLPKIKKRTIMLFPKTIRNKIESFMMSADELIGKYIRGALIVALLQGVIIAIVFSLAGIKYALLLGLLACVFDLIPYFGLIAIMILSSLIAVFSEPPILPKVIISIFTIAILHLGEITFISPKIIGNKVGLHPLLIIFSMLIFMYVFGFIGLLIAIPATALILLLIKNIEENRKFNISYKFKNKE